MVNVLLCFKQITKKERDWDFRDKRNKIWNGGSMVYNGRALEWRGRAQNTAFKGRYLRRWSSVGGPGLKIKSKS